MRDLQIEKNGINTQDHGIVENMDEIFMAESDITDSDAAEDIEEPEDSDDIDEDEDADDDDAISEDEPDAEIEE